MLPGPGRQNLGGTSVPGCGSKTAGARPVGPRAENPFRPSGLESPSLRSPAGPAWRSCSRAKERKVPPHAERVPDRASPTGASCCARPPLRRAPNRCFPYSTSLRLYVFLNGAVLATERNFPREASNLSNLPIDRFSTFVLFFNILRGKHCPKNIAAKCLPTKCLWHFRA